MFSEFNTRPGCASVNASPCRLPVTTHHSRPRRLAKSYLVRLFHSQLPSGLCRRTPSPLILPSCLKVWQTPSRERWDGRFFIVLKNSGDIPGNVRSPRLRRPKSHYASPGEMAGSALPTAPRSNDAHSKPTAGPEALPLRALKTPLIPSAASADSEPRMCQPLARFVAVSRQPKTCSADVTVGNARQQVALPKFGNLPVGLALTKFNAVAKQWQRARKALVQPASVLHTEHQPPTDGNRHLVHSTARRMDRRSAAVRAPNQLPEYNGLAEATVPFALRNRRHTGSACYLTLGQAKNLPSRSLRGSRGSPRRRREPEASRACAGRFGRSRCGLRRWPRLRQRRRPPWWLRSR
jgi:hypothetical protein